MAAKRLVPIHTLGGAQQFHPEEGGPSAGPTELGPPTGGEEDEEVGDCRRQREPSLR